MSAPAAFVRSLSNHALCARCGRTWELHYGGAVKRCDSVAEPLVPAPPRTPSELSVAVASAREQLIAVALEWVTADENLERAAAEAMRASSVAAELLGSARVIADGREADAQTQIEETDTTVLDAVRRSDNARGWLDAQIADERKANARLRISASRLAALSKLEATKDSAPEES